MATDDQQRLVVGTAATPATFTVPGNGQIRPKAIFAHFDGSGAAGSFKPALKITSDAGKLVGIYPAASFLAAGGSAEVSWFPGVGAQGTSVTSSNLMACRVNLVGNLNIPQGDPGTVVTWGEAAFDTGSPTPFWSAGSPTLLTAPVTGLYLSAPNPIWDTFAPGVNVDAELAFYLYAGAQVPDGFHALSKESETPQGASHFTFAGQHHSLTQLNAGDTVKINAYFNQGTSGVASLDLLDMRTIGYTTLVTSWSMMLVAETA